MNTKLLIVDDEKSIRETISDYFQDSGWSVENFSSGEEALNFLEKSSVEYIIVDGRLPKMSGTAFIRKALNIRSEIKFLIYTGSFDFEIEDDLRASGISEKNIVLKPAMRFSVLRDALEQIGHDSNKGE